MTRTTLVRISAICVGLLVAFGSSETGTPEARAQESADAIIVIPSVPLHASSYLTNAIGLGISGGYSPFHLETDLAKNIKKSLDENAPGDLDPLQYWSVL